MSPRSRIAVALILVSSLSWGLGACGDDEPTPKEASQKRVEELFVAAFGEDAATCMLDQFDDDMIASLDSRGELPQGAALDEFTAIAQECVLGEDGTVPGSDTSTTNTTTTAGTPAETSAPTSGPPSDPASEPSAGADSTPATRPDTEAGPDADDAADAEPDGSGNRAGSDAATDRD